MWDNPKLFLNKKPVVSKLAEYGFVEKNRIYSLSKDIMGGTFVLKIQVSKDNSTHFCVIDKESGEEYTLIFNSDAVGSFVGEIRDECERALADIVKKCYENDVFKSNTAKAAIDYIRQKYSAKAEFLWAETPNCAIFRKNATGKWFAVIMTIGKRKLGIDEDGFIEVMNLKDAPESILRIVDKKSYFPAYHMNKKHWYTLLLDGSIPKDELFTCIDNSYRSLK